MEGATINNSVIGVYKYKSLKTQKRSGLFLGDAIVDPY